MVWRPAQTVGDRDPLIPAAKRMLRKYSYGKALGDTDEYTAEFGVALRQFQANVAYQVAFHARPGPTVSTGGVFDWATKKQLGLLEVAGKPSVPVVFTVAGHLGGLFDGPAYFTARALEERGMVRVQPVGYDNVALPFRTPTALTELDRLVRDPVVLPPGTPWMIASHSQGAIATSDYVQHVVLPRKTAGDQPFTRFLGGLHFGNPRRPKGVVAPWINDPPATDTEGLSPDCLPAAIPGVMEVTRRGDLYAANRPHTQASEWRQAIYLAAAEGRFTGTDSLAEQIGELVTRFGAEAWAIFQAITSGIQFVINMDPHNVFDLRPCVDHLSRLIEGKPV